MHVFLVNLDLLCYILVTFFNHIFFIQVLQATLMKQMEIEATLEALKDSDIKVKLFSRK